MSDDPDLQPQDAPGEARKRRFDLSNEPSFGLDVWKVEPAHLKLKKHDVEVQLEPRVMKLLVILAEAGGDVRSRNDLLDSVWSDVVVGDDALTMAVSKLRRALGQRCDGGKFLETIPRVGYRLLVERSCGMPGPPMGDSSPPMVVQNELESRSQRRLRPGRGPVLFVGLLLIVFAGIYALKRPEVVDSSGPLPPLPPTTYHLTASTGYESQATFDPAARRVAFVHHQEGDWGISVLDLSTNETALVFSGAATFPRWSPVDQRIAFLRRSEGDWFLSVVAASGGPSEDVLEVDPAPLNGIDWSPDGRALAWSEYSYAIRTYSVFEVDVESASTRRLTYPADDTLGDARPNYSPDGKYLAFTRGLRAHGRDLWLLDLQTLEIRQLTHDQKRINGFDWRSDSSGLIVAMNRTGPFQLWTVPVAGGEPVWLPTPGDQVRYPTVAGSSVAYDSFGILTDLFEVSREGGERRLDEPSSNGRELAPAWSPNGSRLAYASDRSGTTEIWLLEADGSIRRVSDLGASSIFSIAWSPDATQVVVSGILDEYQILIVDLRTGDSRRLETPDQADSFGGVFTPDGLTVTFICNASGRKEAWQVGLGSQAAPTQFTDFGVASIRFGEDGTAYVLSGTELRQQTRDGSWQSRLTDFSPLVWAGSHLYGWTVKARNIHAVMLSGGRLQWVQWPLNAGGRSVVADFESSLDSSGFAVHPSEEMAVVALFQSLESDLRMMALDSGSP